MGLEAGADYLCGESLCREKEICLNILRNIPGAIDQVCLFFSSPEDVQALVSGKLALRYAGRQVGDALTTVLMAAHSEAACCQTQCLVRPCSSGLHSALHSLPQPFPLSSFSVFLVLLILGLKSLVLLWVSGGLRNLQNSDLNCSICTELGCI